MSSKNTDGGRLMHSKSDNKEINKADELIEELIEFFQSLLSRYQVGLEITMKGSSFMLIYCITNVVK